MRAMDSRRDFTSKKVFPGYFSELGEKANSGLPEENQKKTKRKPKENQNECCSGSASALFLAALLALLAAGESRALLRAPTTPAAAG